MGALIYPSRLTLVFTNTIPHSILVPRLPGDFQRTGVCTTRLLRWLRSPRSKIAVITKIVMNAKIRN